MANKQLSVVIPTLNEAGNIELLIKRTHKALTQSNIGYELIFIDDHSTDETRDIIRRHAQVYPIRLEFKHGKKGKAQSLLEGFQIAQYDLIAMMDADLQYSPEEIPVMVEKLDDGYDVIQSHREAHQEGFLRALSSKIFNFFFIRILHGMKLDTQSALKVFRRQIIQEIDIHPTPWTFDLEFLIQARHAGYKITSHDIIFEDRQAGVSKINLLQATWEIATNALKLKFQPLLPIMINSDSDSPEIMTGAGIAHKGQRFITHSSLSHDISALVTMVAWQKVFIISTFLLLGIGFFMFPLSTAIIFTAVLSFIYFADVLFNFYVVSKSLSTPPDLTFSESAINSLPEAELPVYTILCPLFREAHVLPGFVAAIEKLDWPKDKLDVILLLEENDSATITAARDLGLPSYFRTAIVPQSMPQTKPKACNYGLNLAQGEFLVVYDAEDMPEADQLKKAYLGFMKSGPQVVCLQAKLNYYNPHDNFLTRLFTAEYSLWFDVILPGLQSINGYIPLGGTSNHFRTQTLRDLRGWDPFNVTEDCDLGARLFKRGFRTAIIDSTTLEEANSDVWNWMRQRSRWIKGYMQTYLVHMRNPLKFFKESGGHAGIFQLVVGGKIGFMLINPFLWILTITYFALRSTVGPAIEAIYPPVVFYIAITSLIVGNFLCLYYYMIGCAKREHWSLIKYIYLVPLYWLMTSTAATIALYQLIVKPHYWEKTNHGLQKKVSAVPEQASVFTKVFGRLSPRVWSGGTALIVAMSAANFLNFFFNALLGRVISLEQLAVVTLANTIWSLVALLLTSVGTTVNSKIAFLTAEKLHDQALAFRRRVFMRGLPIVLAGSLVWLALTPVFVRFFHLSNPWMILFFVPMFSFAFISVVNQGFLQGRIRLIEVAGIILFESFSKVCAAIVLLYFDLDAFAYLAIPISVVLTAIYSWYIYRKLAPTKTENVPGEAFPKSFYLAVLLSGLSYVVFMNLDVLLVNHYLDSTQAGQYALLSLVGKMVFYFGSLPNALMVTFISRDLGLNKNPVKTFYLLLSLTTAFVVGVGAVLTIFGHNIIPILLGARTTGILSFVPVYILAMALFTITNIFVTYHLVRKQYEFPFASLLMSVVMGVMIMARHADILAVVSDIIYASVFGLGLVLIMHILNPASRNEEVTDNFTGQRILIFNWRDTVHAFAGGAEVYIQEIAKELVTQGNRVTIFAGNDKKSKREEVIDGIHIIRRGGFFLVYFWAVVYYFAKFRGEYDVIIDCQNGVPFFTPLYVKEPVFCLMHHVHQEVFTISLAKPLAAFARFLEKGVMPIVYKNTRFITVSQSSKQAIEEIGLGRAGVDIVYPGIGLNLSATFRKNPFPTILYLGRLKAYKSIDVLIKAFAIVIQKQPRARLVIAGIGEEISNLKRLVRELDLDTKVTFMGRVSEEKKIELLHKAWVFVNPSFMEGWGITTVEANACGTPIVAADVPGLRDSVLDPHAGYLVPHGDFPGFADRILQIILDKELRANMGREARVWAANFDWQKNSKIFLSIISLQNELAAEYYKQDETS